MSERGKKKKKNIFIVNEEAKTININIFCFCYWTWANVKNVFLLFKIFLPPDIQYLRKHTGNSFLW